MSLACLVLDSNGGVFVTADRRHIANVGQYGNVVLLQDWESDLCKLTS